jgi:cobalt-zinc-cadmium efflux system outer membrane protein
MPSFGAGAFLAACLLVISPATRAQSVVNAPLTLPQSIKRALDHRPELGAFAFRLTAQEAHRAEVGLKPPLQVEALIEDVAGTGYRKGIDSAQTSLLLSHIIELGDKRAGRQNIADAESGRLSNERAAAQLDVVADVARRFIAVLEGQQRLELATQSVRIAEDAEKRVNERVNASRSPPAEAARAGVQLWDARLIFEDAEHELEIARHFLAAAMGANAIDFGPAQADLMSLTGVGTLDELTARISANPHLLRFASEERIRDAELRLAELQRRADPRFTFGIRRFEQGDDLGLVAGVTLPLFAGQRAQPRIDAARAERARVALDREASLLKLKAQLFSQHTQLQHEVGLSRKLRDELLPRLQTALEQTSYAYERGRYSYLEWTTAQRELLEGRLRLIESAARYHVLRIEIERLTGQSLEPAGARP